MSIEYGMQILAFTTSRSWLSFSEEQRDKNPLGPSVRVHKGSDQLSVPSVETMLLSCCSEGVSPLLFTHVCSLTII